MRYLALATDYDGTLAQGGRVSDDTLDAIRRLRQSGRKVILISGRVLSDLETVFSHFELFDSVVAENGAVLYTPSTREKQALAPPPHEGLVAELRRPWRPAPRNRRRHRGYLAPQETAVLESIRELGLEMQVIFNKGAVMVLPSGINKRSGLCAALEALALSEHEVVGIGDAENDHAFLRSCECAVAVANAHPAIKETADFTTRGDHGAGAVELIDLIVANQLDGRIPNRHWVPLGREDGREVCVPASGSTLLVAGTSGSGKSTFIAGLLPRLQEMRQRTGRPHWIIADGAHHMLGADWAPASPELANQLQNLILITVHPDHVSPVALKAVDGLVSIGAQPGKAAQSSRRSAEPRAR